MNKKIFFIIAVIFGSFFLIFFISTILNIKNAKYVKDAIVEIKLNDDVFNNFNAYRISPSGFQSLLIKDNKNTSFYSIENQYLKRIKITFNVDDFEKIDRITVKIGNKKYSFLNNQINENWEVEKNDDKIILLSDSSVLFKKSRLPYFNKIINWPGDFSVFVKNFLSALIFYLIFFCIFIFIKLFTDNYLNRIIKTGKIKKIIDCNNSDEFNKYFTKNDSNYSLKKNISGLEKIKVFLQVDRYDKNYYRLFLLVSFFAVILIALAQRFILDSLPYSGGDGWGYIGPPVKILSGGDFVHVTGRSFLYPLFLLIILKNFNDFSYISIIQHLLGIISGILIFYLFRKVSKNFFVSRLQHAVIDFTGLAAMGLFLFSPSPIVLEHHLRPESIYPFFLILLMIFLYHFLISIKVKNNYKYIFGTLFFILNYFLYIFQPRWGLTFLFNILVYIALFMIIIVRERQILRNILILFFVPAVISFSAIYVPENILIKNETARESFLYGTLFWAHSKIIDIELENDINDPEFEKYDKEILRQVRKYMDENFKKKQTKHKHLGFLFNRLMHDKANYYLHDKFTPDEYKKFCIYYFFKGIKKHPFMYSKKVILELSQFYNIKGNMYSPRKYKYDPEIYFDGFERVGKYNASYLAYRKYINALTVYKDSFYDFKEIEVAGYDVIFFILSLTYMPVLLLFILITFVDLIRRIKNKKFDLMFLFVFFISNLFLYNFFISLTNSLIYCLDVSRYIDDQFIIVVVSHFFAFVYLFIKFKSFIFKKLKSN